MFIMVKVNKPTLDDTEIILKENYVDYDIYQGDKVIIRNSDISVLDENKIDYEIL